MKEKCMKLKLQQLLLRLVLISSSSIPFCRGVEEQMHSAFLFELEAVFLDEMSTCFSDMMQVLHVDVA